MQEADCLTAEGKGASDITHSITRCVGHHSQHHIAGELNRYEQRCDNLKCYKSDFLTCSLHMSVNRWISASIVNLVPLPAHLHHSTHCLVGTSSSESPCAFVSKKSYLLVASTKRNVICGFHVSVGLMAALLVWSLGR